jgi:hypothetical protein
VADYLPKFDADDAFTITASGTITGGQLVTGAGAVAGADAINWVGVAGHDAVSGDKADRLLRGRPAAHRRRRPVRRCAREVRRGRPGHRLHVRHRRRRPLVGVTLEAASGAGSLVAVRMALRRPRCLPTHRPGHDQRPDHHRRPADQQPGPHLPPAADPVQQRLVGDKLLSGRVDLTGSGSPSTRSPSRSSRTCTDEIVDQLAEYPLSTDTPGTIAAANTVKRGLASEISDELIARARTQRPTRSMRKLIKLANRIVFSSTRCACPRSPRRSPRRQAAVAAWNTVDRRPAGRRAAGRGAGGRHAEPGLRPRTRGAHAHRSGRPSSPTRRSWQNTPRGVEQPRPSPGT